MSESFLRAYFPNISKNNEVAKAMYDILHVKVNQPTEQFPIFKKTTWKWYTRCDQKVCGKICLGEIHWIKTFVSGSFDLIEGYWDCENHVAMFGCLCKALLSENGATSYAKWRKLKSERSSSTSVRKEWLPRKFITTSWKPLGMSLLLIAQWKKWAAAFKKGGERLEDDGRSGRPKDATTDENVKVLQPWLYVIGGETCEA